MRKKEKEREIKAPTDEFSYFIERKRKEERERKRERKRGHTPPNTCRIQNMENVQIGSCELIILVSAHLRLLDAKVQHHAVLVSQSGTYTIYRLDQVRGVFLK